MNQLLLGATFCLPFLVIGSGVAAGYFLVMMFFGLPVGWSLSLALFDLFLMGGGYKIMCMVNSNPEISRRVNTVAAPAMMIGAGLCLTLWFVRSGAAYVTSQWWALSLPVAVIGFVFLQLATQALLDFINPEGARP